MGYYGEPILKPVVIAVALIYVALVSQPLWAKKSASTGQALQPDPAVHIDATSTQNLFSSD